jgi:hypothetical protein
MVAEVGVERALEKLYDAGVYVTVEEFKGRAPIQRDGLEIPVTAADFDNPLVNRGTPTSTSGSRGAPMQSHRPFPRMTSDAYMEAALFDDLGCLERPWAEWRQGDTAFSIRYAKIGKKMERSFSTLDFSPRALGLWTYVGDRLNRYFMRSLGIPVLAPQFVPASDPMPIVRWLAAKKAAGQPALLHTFGSSALRICQVALENGIDITGTAIAVTGEPFTPAKARVVADAGVQAWPKYASTEVSTIGRACLAPLEADEVHANTDKIALIQRERMAAGSGVQGLFLTGLHTFFAKVVLNVEIGDYATLSQRDCGCPSQRLGLTTHISGVRSYEKLTSEGVTYLGGDIATLLEQTLPQRFGGQVGDYQLVEEEEAGVTRINIYVAPSVGEVDDSAVIGMVLEAMASEAFGHRRRMGELLQGAGVLRVVRRQPLLTGRAKMMLVHALGITQLQTGASEKSTAPPA